MSKIAIRSGEEENRFYYQKNGDIKSGLRIFLNFPKILMKSASDIQSISGVFFV